MPSLLRIRVERCQDLPVMDKNLSGDASTDAYVEIKLADSHYHRTQTCRKSLNPIFNEEFKLEVSDDSLLQDEPLEIKVLDQDLYSSEPIGVTFIDLNPLIMRTATTSLSESKNLVIKGWFPLFSTVAGVRGSILISVKLQFIGNDNPFKDSSAGVQFFSASVLASNQFIIQDILGFVEDLVVEDDPESSWQDYFLKANRQSNDTRLKLLYNLSAEVRRGLGKKVIELGGNAVLAYNCHLDVEAQSGIVVRAYGTACRLVLVDYASAVHLRLPHTMRCHTRQSNMPNANPSNYLDAIILGNHLVGLLDDAVDQRGPRRSGVQQNSNVGLLFPKLHVKNEALSSLLTNDSSSYETSTKFDKASSDSITSDDVLLQSLRSSCGTSEPMVLLQIGMTSSSIKSQHPSISDSGKDGTALVVPLVTFGLGSSTTGKEKLIIPRELGARIGLPIGADSYGSEWTGIANTNMNDFQAEVHLISLKTFPRHVRVRLGGLVVARAVKFLGKLDATQTDQENREGWFQELRDEIKSHCKTLCCGYVIGYSESCTMIGEVLVLSAVGTAAAIKGLTHPSIILDSRVSSQDSTATISPKSARSFNGNISDNEDYNLEANLRTTSSTIQGNLNHFENCNISPTLDTPHVRKSAFVSSQQFGFVSSSSDAKRYLSANCSRRLTKEQRPCAALHVPYNHNTAPFGFMRLVPCLVCRRKWVPEILLSTIEPPESVSIRGKGQLLEARVCRTRRGGPGETDAVRISEVLPFLEFDVQRQIMLKLKVLGMNSVFGYSSKIEIGIDIIIATATSTALYLEALPPSPLISFSRSIREYKLEDARLASLQRDLEELCSRNKRHLEESSIANLDGQIARKVSPGGASDIRQRENIDADAFNIGHNSSPSDGIIEHSSVAATRKRSSSRGTDNDVSDASESSSSSSSSSSESESEGSSLESPPSSSSSSSSSSSESDSDSDGDAQKSDINLVNANTGEALTDLKSLSGTTGERNESVSILSSSLRSPGQTVSISQKSVNFASDVNDREKKISLQPPGLSGADLNSTSRKVFQLTETGAISQLQKSTRYSRRVRTGIFKDDRPPFVLEIDDETDADIVAVLTDWESPVGIDMVNVEFVPGSLDILNGTGRNICIIRRGSIRDRGNSTSGVAASVANNSVRLARSSTNRVNSTGGQLSSRGLPSPNGVDLGNNSCLLNDKGLGGSTNSLNQNLTSLFKDAYIRLCFSVRESMPCQILSLKSSFRLLEDGTLELMMTGMMFPASKSSMKQQPDESRLDAAILPSSSPVIASSADVNHVVASEGVKIESLHSHPIEISSATARRNSGAASNPLVSPSSSPLTEQPTEPQLSTSLLSSSPNQQPGGLISGPGNLSRANDGTNAKGGPSLRSQRSEDSRFELVILSVLSIVPGYRIKRYLGPVQLHFLKDSLMRGEGSLETFWFSFLSEAQISTRAQVVALGGNALLCHRVSSQECGGRMRRYNIISVTGDAVWIEPITPSGNHNSISNGSGTSLFTRYESSSVNLGIAMESAAISRTINETSKRTEWRAPRSGSNNDC